MNKASESVNDKPEIYLVRHGETVWNRQGRLQGQKDSPLTTLGLRQARQVGEILRGLLGAGADLPLITSPLGRAWQTAVIITEVLEREPDELRHDERLKERNYGDFEGKTGEELSRDLPEAFAQFRMQDPNYQIPGGESLVQMDARIGQWLAAQPPARPRVVVCHGITSQVLRGLYLDLPGEQWLEQPKTQGVVFHLKDGALETLSG